MKEWHFFEKVYRVWVVFVICPPDEFKDFMNAVDFKHTDELNCENANGMCIRLNSENNTTGQNCYVVWLQEYETASLVHEIAHLVMHIFDDQGVKLSMDNTEGFAFYSEYWFNELTRVRKRLPNGRTPAQARRTKYA